MQMKTFLAIDFGTTQSSVARFTDSLEGLVVVDVDVVDVLLRASKDRKSVV